MPQKIDMTGHNYGRWTVLYQDTSQQFKRPRWISKCTCGVIKSVGANSLRMGSSLSCGCLHIETITTHGKYGTRLHRIMNGMKDRCYNKNSDNWKYYGGIGVTICKEWLDSLENFINWAIKNNYSDNLTINREKGSLIYSPETCNWATSTTQMRDRGKTRKKKTTSKYIGVFRVDYIKSISWRACITVNKVVTTLGYFNTELEAAKARDKYILDNSLKHFRLNFKRNK